MEAACDVLPMLAKRAGDRADCAQLSNTMDHKTKELLQEHNRIRMAYSRLNGIGAPPCFECKAETEVWWNYCAMCGHHIAAGRS